MASKSGISLKDEVECPVCLNIYEDPQILVTCLHSFCKRCIQPLEDRGRVQCPMCRMFASKKKIVQDFKTQRLVDLFHLQESSKVSYFKASVCGMCKEHKSIKALCTQCNHYMCEGCEKIHLVLKPFEDHTVNQVSDNIKGFETKFQKNMTHLQQRLEIATDKESKLSQNKVAVQEAANKQMKDLNEFTDNAIRKLEQHKQKLERLICGVSTVVTRKIELKRLWFNRTKTIIQNDIDTLTNVIENDGIDKVLNEAENLDGLITKTLQDSSNPFETMSIEHAFPVDISERDLSDITKNVGCVVNGVDYHTWGENRCAIYNKIDEEKYEIKNQINVNHSVYKICLVDDKLWLPANDCICIYTKQCKLVTTLQHSKLNSVLTLTQCGSNQVAVGCSDNQGLHQILTTSLRYHSQIAEGSFSDTCYFNTYLYALDFEKRKILVFSQSLNTSKWTRVKEIDISHTKCGHVSDWLSVYKDDMLSICVASSINSIFYVLDIDGVNKETIRKAGDVCSISKWPSDLKLPLLCGADGMGNILLTDFRQAGKLYLSKNIISGLRDWKYINLTGPAPLLHATVDNNGDIWAVSKVPSAIFHYAKNSQS